MYRLDLFEHGVWNAYGWFDTEAEAREMGLAFGSLKFVWRTERDPEMTI